MKRAWAIGIIVALGAGVMAQAQAARSAEVQMKAAQQKAEVEGDLKGAIEEYKKVVAAAGSNRALAAEALVRMADCYDKLGDTQARITYERVVREFSDQAEQVALAQVHLNRGERSDRPRALALRKVWDNDTREIAGARSDTQYAISADGRYMTYVDNYNTALVLRDLTSGTDRRLTAGGYPGPSPYGGIYHSTISPDGAQVAFNSCTANQTTCEIRVASLTGTGIPVSRRLFGADDVTFIAPQDWSPDGKWLAVSLQRKDRTAQVGLLAVSDGALRVLKSVDWRGTTRMFFSPDGRDVAFDQPVDETSVKRDVFVLATDGSREVAAVAHPSNDIVIGWTPDGAHLLFASDRGGAMGLWGQAFRERKPQGGPELVKPDIGNVSPLGITRSGAQYLAVRATNQDVELASIDLTTGKQIAPPVKPAQRFTGSNSQPTWSPNGRSLAYVSERGEESVVVIRSMDTGNTRELDVPPGLPYFSGLTWAPDGGSFAVRGQDLKGRVGVFRIDARSGDVVPIRLRSPAEYLTYEGFFWSPDARRMYYHGNLGSIYELDLASGNERILVSGPAADDGLMGPVSRMGPISLSPDGRWIAASRSEPSTKSQTVMLIPVDGGEPQELLRVSEPERIGNRSTWAPDGRGILIKKETNVGTELWFVPISGESPRKIDLDVRSLGTIRLHPDGRQIAFDSTQFSSEVWVLENFLPALKTRR